MKKTDTSSDGGGSTAAVVADTAPELLQPSLTAEGWSDPIDEHAPEICAALLFAHHMCKGDWEAVKNMALKPEMVAEWQETFEGMVENQEPVRIDPEPLSYQIVEDPKRLSCTGWAYIPLFLETSEMLEAVSMDIYNENQPPHNRGYYDLEPLSGLPGFSHIKDVQVPRAIRLDVLEFGRP